MKTAASFLSAACFAAGLLVFALPAENAAAQTTTIPPLPLVSAEGCPLRVLGSVYDEAAQECACPSGEEIFEPFPTPDNLVGFCEAPLAADACSHITGGAVDTANNICGCADLAHEFFDKDAGPACESPAACVGGIRTGENVCECPTGFTDNGGGTCEQDLATVVAPYEASDCRGGGWGVSDVTDGSGVAAQVCAIPLLGQGDIPTARQFSPSARATGCVLGADAGFDFTDSAVSGLPRCGAADVFGDRGIPPRPADFNPAQHRVVLSCPSGFERDPNDPRRCVAARAVGGGGGTDSGGTGGKTTSAQHFALGAGIIILAGAAFGVWNDDGNLSAFSLSPTADYEYEDGAWRARHGTRLDYHSDEWTLWWTAEQVRAADESESRFGWGGQWRGEILRLDAAARISDGATDLRAGAGAEWDFRGWALRPSWRVRAETAERGAWSGRMDADLAAEWARLGWKIRPSFGATGSLRDAETDGAFMRLRVERTLGR